MVIMLDDYLLFNYYRNDTIIRLRQMELKDTPVIKF